jgi:hypothetical protein
MRRLDRIPEINRTSSAFVTSSTEFEIDTPTDMIIPYKIAG